jgi:hypothetical protein
MMKIIKLHKHLFIILLINCTSFEIISPGLNSNSELKLIRIKNKALNLKNQDDISIKVFKIIEKENLKEILSDENNTFLPGDSLSDFKDFDLNKYDYYLFSYNISDDLQTIDLSKNSISIGNIVPEKNLSYIYDFVIISKFKNGIAGSMEAMTISTDTYPIKPENTYNNRSKSMSYGYTLVKYQRTVRILTAFIKTDINKLEYPIVFVLNPNIEAKFSKNLDYNE